MLKRIATDQVRLGMFIQSLEGSWLSHPFWKTRFLLEDPADLEALRQSKVAAVLIDTSRGGDVAAAAPAEAAMPAVPPAAAPPDGPRSLSDELEQAAAVMAKSRQAVVGMLGEARLGRAVKPELAAEVVEDIAGSVWRNPSALISLARLKTRDDYTYMHSVAVCALMIALAKQLGMDEAAQRDAGMAGLLHDVGKMLMPLNVLNKPGALSDDEFAVMRLHPERGHEALRIGEAFSAGVLDVCLHHHEKMDGSGYPHKLAGADISLLARMGAVCDVYDAITSNRPYKTAWDPAASIARMAQWSGHFDPAIFQAFVVSLGIYPVGSLVRLQSGRLAVVVEQNAGKLTQPKLRVFFSTKSNMPVSTQDLDLAEQGSDRIVGREDPSAWGFTHLTELWAQPR